MKRNEGGFTMVEVLIAVVILAIGVVALASGAGMANRMLGRGRATTYASQIATDQLERLRTLGAATAVPCTHPNFLNGTAPADHGVSIAWTIDVIPLPGNPRLVTVTATYRTAQGERSDVFTSAISCK